MPRHRQEAQWRWLVIFMVLTFILALVVRVTLPADQLQVLQTLFFLWTVVAAVFAAIYAGRSWVATARTLQVSTYLTLSANWNQVVDRVKVDKDALSLLRKRRNELTDDQWWKVLPAIQELFTTFDAWLVANKLGAFPVIEAEKTADLDMVEEHNSFVLQRVPPPHGCGEIAV